MWKSAVINLHWMQLKTTEIIFTLLLMCFFTKLRDRNKKHIITHHLLSLTSKLKMGILSRSSSPDVIYVSAAGSMLCQIINSLLLLPVSVARPLLSHLLDLLPPLDRLNRLLPAASPLEDQELQWPLHGELETTILLQTYVLSCLLETYSLYPLGVIKHFGS